MKISSTVRRGADGKGALYYLVGCQLIFSDIGTPKRTWSDYDLSTEFDVYNYIKEELIKKGIPKE